MKTLIPKKTFVVSTGLTLLILPALAETAGSFDWPQWQGANRDGISKETGLRKAWGPDGPDLAWKLTTLGSGYGGPSIAAGRIFGLSNRGKDEVVWALAEKDGSELWATRLGAIQAGGMPQGIEGGGCTPTVEGDRLFVLGQGGDLACLQVSDGKILWQRNLIKDFGGRLPTWRFNESPLIDGARVICTPGGVESTLVALNKATGELVWKCGIPDAGLVPVAAGNPGREAGSVPDRGERPSAERPPGTPREDEAAPAPAEARTDSSAVIIPSGSRWRYLDTGVAPSDNWATVEFDDTAWQEGAAELGYGDGDEKTKIDDSPESYPTYYFRRVFEVKDLASLKPLILRLLRDDGAVVYLNGKEIVRDNMPADAIKRDTFAESATPSERGFYAYDLDPGKLVAGKNVMAVEVHQASADSSDVSFDLELREKVPGRDVVGAPRLDRRRGGFPGGGGGRGSFGGSGAAYSSAIAVDFAGQRQIVQFTAKALVGVAAADGKLLWRYDRPSGRMGINCSTPIYLEGHVFAASAYGAGGGLARLSKTDEGGMKAEEVWFSRSMENHHGGMVVIDGCLYGANGGNSGGYLVCLDFQTGEVLWDEGEREKRRARKGSLACADGRIYYRTEEGVVLLIEPNRAEYVERGRFEQPERTRQPAWTHPVIANGKLYIRDQDLLLCYNLKDEGR